MRIISISGLDGSGKSTQTQLLKSHLESQGKRVFYFHAIAFSLATKLSNLKKKYCLICKIKGACKTDTTSKSVTSANWLQIQLRKIFLRIDICRFKNFVEKLNRKGYDYIISDRFFQDAFVNIAYLENSQYGFSRNLKTEIKNITQIYLRNDPGRIMKREQKPEQGITYLEDKKILYDRYFQNYSDTAIIDGDQKKESVFEEIKNTTKYSLT